MYCRNFTVLSSFFDVKKQRPKANFKNCYRCSVNIEISLDLKVYFYIVTCKSNNCTPFDQSDHWNLCTVMINADI